MKKTLVTLQILLCIIFTFNAIAQESTKPLRIGLIADIQYADKADSKTRFYRGSLAKLDQAVEALNQDSLSFTAIFGDYVDEGPKDVEPILSRLRKLNNPFFGLLGNHDYVKDFDPKLHQKYTLEKAYYTLNRGEWTFLFLNTNELSEYAVEKGSRMEQEFLELANKQKALNRENVTPWNGGISQKQMKWLVKEIRMAEKNNKKVIVFTHHPILPENGLEALNNQEMLALFIAHPVVKAVLSGHHHTGNYVNHQGLPLITLEGMVETKDQNAFGVLELEPNKMKIQGTGRLISREINLR